MRRRVGLSMLDLLAFAASTRQIHQGLGASGANPKARVQAVDSVRRAPYARLLDLGPTTRPSLLKPCTPRCTRKSCAEARLVATGWTRGTAARPARPHHGRGMPPLQAPGHPAMNGATLTPWRRVARKSAAGLRRRNAAVTTPRTSTFHRRSS